MPPTDKPNEVMLPFNRDPILALQQAISALRDIVRRERAVRLFFDCDAFIDHELQPALQALLAEQTKAAAPSAASPIKAVTVTSPDGSPVAAPCAISGCQYPSAERSTKAWSEMSHREREAHNAGGCGVYTAASSARSTYVPLTREEIEKVRSVYKRHFSDGERLDTVCDMAINALLYAQEIDRLRSAPSAIEPPRCGLCKAYVDAAGRCPNQWHHDRHAATEGATKSG